MQSSPFLIKHCLASSTRWHCLITCFNEGKNTVSRSLIDAASLLLRLSQVTQRWVINTSAWESNFSSCIMYNSNYSKISSLQGNIFKKGKPMHLFIFWKDCVYFFRKLTFVFFLFLFPHADYLTDYYCRIIPRGTFLQMLSFLWSVHIPVKFTST